MHYAPDVLQQALPTMTRARPELLSCPTWYVVVHPGTDEIVGCGGWTRHVPNSAQQQQQSCNNVDDNNGNDKEKKQQHQPHLRHFAVHPKYARQGVGRAVWDRTWNDICDELGPSTRLEVFSTLTAVPFYKSLGFRIVKHMGICMGASVPIQFPCVLMERIP